MRKSALLVVWCTLFGVIAGSRECEDLEALKEVVRSQRMWQRLCSFVKDEARFRVNIDTRCSTSSKTSIGGKEDFDSRWSLDSLLPRLIRQSRWYSKLKANATLVAFEAKKMPRSALSLCARRFQTRDKLWITASTDRGRCCDGGQLRDPLLLEMHLLTTNGEARRGRFLFREQNKKHSWRAPASRDTGPRLRCFDERRDLVLPPPAFIVREAQADLLYSKNKSFLVMHAEGGQGPPEYELRRAVTLAWARDWWQGAAEEDEVKRLEARGIHLAIKKQMTKLEHTKAMASSRYCLVIEGYAPWTPRLTEAIKHGCIPVLLSPSYRPPFADFLDWSKFAVMLQPQQISALPQLLLDLDYQALSTHLNIVRPFFAFYLTPSSDKHALTLLLFQMYQRTKWSSLQKNKKQQPSAVSQQAQKQDSVFALTADEHGTDLSDPSRASRTSRQTYLQYSCIQDGAQCDLQFDQQHWRCKAVSDTACSCQRSPEKTTTGMSHISN